MNIEADAYIHPTNGTYYLGLKTYFQKCLFKYANTIDLFFRWSGRWSCRLNPLIFINKFSFKIKVGQSILRNGGNHIKEIVSELYKSRGVLQAGAGNNLLYK